MRSTDFGSIVSPVMLGSAGGGRHMARGGHAKAPTQHRSVVIVSPSPIVGALLAAMMMRHATEPGRSKQGALGAALAKRKKR